MTETSSRLRTYLAECASRKTIAHSFTCTIVPPSMNHKEQSLALTSLSFTKWNRFRPRDRNSQKAISCPRSFHQDDLLPSLGPLSVCWVKLTSLVDPQSISPSDNRSKLLTPRDYFPISPTWYSSIITKQENCRPATQQPVYQAPPKTPWIT